MEEGRGTQTYSPSSAAGDESSDGPEVAEMPINLDIEVEAVPLEEYDIEHLRLDTR